MAYTTEKAREGFWSVFKGRLGQVLRNNKGHEYYRRPPGVRAIIPTDTGLIMQREKRAELEYRWDYRLPGGKVCDTFAAFENFLKSDNPIVLCRSAMRGELRTEIGLAAKELVLFYESPPSATIEHILYYFEVVGFTNVLREKEEGETIERVELSYAKIYELLKERKITEPTTRAVLYEYLLKNKKIKI